MIKIISHCRYHQHCLFFHKHYCCNHYHYYVFYPYHHLRLSYSLALLLINFSFTFPSLIIIIFDKHECHPLIICKSQFWILLHIIILINLFDIFTSIREYTYTHRLYIRVYIYPFVFPPHSVYPLIHLSIKWIKLAVYFTTIKSTAVYFSNQS